MRWLIAIIAFDVAVAVWLITGATEPHDADLVFASSSLHNSLDPQQLSWSHDIRVVENLFEPLTRMKLPELTPEPAAAESWTVSDDGLTYTFKIRDSARWSNGDPVTSHDFHYAWRRALLPDLAAQYTQLLWGIRGAESFFKWRSDELLAYQFTPAVGRVDDAINAVRAPETDDDGKLLFDAGQLRDQIETARNVVLHRVDYETKDKSSQTLLDTMQLVLDAERVLEQKKNAKALELLNEARAMRGDPAIALETQENEPLDEQRRRVRELIDAEKATLKPLIAQRVDHTLAGAFVKLDDQVNAVAVIVRDAEAKAKRAGDAASKTLEPASFDAVAESLDSLRPSLQSFADQLAGRFSKEEQREAEARRWLQRAYDHFEKHVGIQTPDKRTLVVTLEQPMAYFLEMCAFITYVPVHAETCDAQTRIIPASGMLQQDPMWIRPVDKAGPGEPALVTNGPYVLQRRRFKRDLLMTANEHYWNRDNMKNDSILELIVPDIQAQILMYHRGEIDWIPNVPSTGSLAADMLKQQDAGDRNDVHAVTSAGTYFYVFNCQEKLPDGAANPFHDPRVRRAFSMAIDREEIVNEITRLKQPIAFTFVPPGSLPGYEPPVEAGVTHDPDRARELLAEAGYPGGKGLTGLSILYNTGSGHESVAQYLQHVWEQELGASIPLQGQEVAIFGDRLKKQDFAVSRAGWFGDYLDATTFLDKFLKENGNNDGKYHNPEYQRLMEQAARELDRDTRINLLRQAEAIMIHEQAIAPLYHYVSIHLFDPQRVRNMHLNAWNFRRLEFVEVAE